MQVVFQHTECATLNCSCLQFLAWIDFICQIAYLENSCSERGKWKNYADCLFYLRSSRPCHQHTMISGFCWTHIIPQTCRCKHTAITRTLWSMLTTGSVLFYFLIISSNYDLPNWQKVSVVYLCSRFLFGPIQLTQVPPCLHSSESSILNYSGIHFSKTLQECISFIPL